MNDMTRYRAEHERHERWRELHGEWLRLLARIRLHEADHGRPKGAHAPALDAACREQERTPAEAVVAALRLLGGRASLGALHEQVEAMNLCREPLIWEVLLKTAGELTRAGSGSGVAWEGGNLVLR